MSIKKRSRHSGFASKLKKEDWHPLRICNAVKGPEA